MVAADLPSMTRVCDCRHTLSDLGFRGPVCREGGMDLLKSVHCCLQKFKGLGLGIS